jgi:hypothetical protein
MNLKIKIFSVIFAFIFLNCAGFIQTSERSCQNARALSLNILAQEKLANREEKISSYDVFLAERLVCTNPYRKGN